MMNFHDFASHAGLPKGKRSTFGMKDCRILATLNEGALFPFFCEEVLPGDVWKMPCNFTLRNLQNVVHPVLDESFTDISWFFVPYRLLWKYWPYLCGVDQPSAYTDPVEYTTPVMSEKNSIVAYGSVFEGLGYGAGWSFSGEDQNVFPYAAYLKIWDEFYRDENLQDSPADIETIYELASGAEFTPTDIGIEDIAGSAAVTSVNKYHDLFTSCLPSPQKGDAVSLPLGDSADVTVSGTFAQSGLRIFNGSSSAVSEQTDLRLGVPGVSAAGSAAITITDGTNNLYGGTSPLISSQVITSTGTADLSTATAATINDLRNSIALQRYFEALALGGSRYTELLKAQFGIAPNDGTLQRPEYLGGCHVMNNVQQVASTAGTGTVGTASKTDTGSLGAYSVTSNAGTHFVKSFEEFGLLIGLVSIRVKHTYGQGVRKHILKRSRFDYYWPEFDRLGEVPVSKKEIYYSTEDTGDTFGFNEAWYEYRHIPARVYGYVNPGLGYSDMMAWHYADDYDAAPTLSSSWIKEDRGRIQQTLAGVSTAPQFLIEIYTPAAVTRSMSVRSDPSALGM